MLDLKTIEKIDKKKVGFFRFKKFDKDTYLLTNDVGKYVFLPEVDFKKLGYKSKQLICEKLFYEQLCVWELII